MRAWRCGPAPRGQEPAELGAVAWVPVVLGLEGERRGTHPQVLRLRLRQRAAQLLTGLLQDLFDLLVQRGEFSQLRHGRPEFGRLHGPFERGPFAQFAGRDRFGVGVHAEAEQGPHLRVAHDAGQAQSLGGLPVPYAGRHPRHAGGHRQRAALGTVAEGDVAPVVALPIGCQKSHVAL